MFLTWEAVSDFVSCNLSKHRPQKAGAFFLPCIRARLQPCRKVAEKPNFLAAAGMRAAKRRAQNQTWQSSGQRPYYGFDICSERKQVERLRYLNLSENC